MRKKLEIAPPIFDAQSTPRADSTLITQEREYKLITPLFGGGAKPGERDQVTTIRGSEIRGQLRFWWRACRGGQFASLQKMKEAEDCIWGKAHKKEKKKEGEERKGKEEDKVVPTVQIRVEIISKGNELDPFKIVQNAKGNNQARETNGIPGYAAFPLQPDQAELKKPDPYVPPVQDAVLFRLIITFFQDQRKEVEAALWAWETFGGIGARTRRGFGSLCCTQSSENGKSIPVQLPGANAREAMNWLREKCDKHVVAGTWPKHVVHLVKQPIAGRHIKFIDRKPANDIFAIWRDLIGKLSSFRQMRTDPTNRAHPGRSKWPEPDAIRQLLNQRLPKHKEPINKPAIYTFPRAAFGLPLPFKFKDDNRHDWDNKDCDPRKSVLQPKGYERLSSPLVLKPLACQNEKAIGMAFILEGTDLKQIPLELQPQEGNKKAVEATAFLKAEENFELKEAAPSLFKKRIDQHTNILHVFLEYL